MITSISFQCDGCKTVEAQIACHSDSHGIRLLVEKGWLVRYERLNRHTPSYGGARNAQYCPACAPVMRVKKEKMKDRFA